MSVHANQQAELSRSKAKQSARFVINPKKADESDIMFENLPSIQTKTDKQLSAYDESSRDRVAAYLLGCGKQ